MICLSFKDVISNFHNLCITRKKVLTIMKFISQRRATNINTQLMKRAFTMRRERPFIWNRVVLTACTFNYIQYALRLAFISFKFQNRVIIAKCYKLLRSISNLSQVMILIIKLESLFDFSYFEMSFIC